MAQLVNECARLIANEKVGPRLHLMVLESPIIAQQVMPGQFIHMKVPRRAQNILRRPFSVYARDTARATIEVLYQEVGELTTFMPQLEDTAVEIIGPVGNCWTGPQRFAGGTCTRALLVGGGVGAAPLFMLAESLHDAGCPFDVVLGAQTADALVTKARYEALCGTEPACATDDGTHGTPGFCTTLVEEALEKRLPDGKPAYDYLAVCGPMPLMKIVSGMALDSGVYCEVSLEKRMACGIGACLSCVVDTRHGKKRSCVDGPIFEAQEVVW